MNVVIIVIVPIIGKTNELVAPMSAPPLATTSASSPPEEESPKPALSAVTVLYPCDFEARYTVKNFASMKDIEKHLQIAGLRTIDHLNKNNRKKVKLTHGFRKFHSKQLLESGLQTEKRWLLEGHDLPRNDLHYIRVSEEELFLEYEKAVNLLTINPENRLQRRVEKLEVEKSSRN